MTSLSALLAPTTHGAGNAAATVLRQFLAAQHGAGAAGSHALSLAHLGAAPALNAPPPIQAGPQGPQALDYSGIQGFYADPSNSDYHNDPVLLQVKAQAIRDQADADAQALAGRRDLVTQLGDRGLAQSVLGQGDPLLPAISDSRDSSSVLGRLSRSYHDTTEQNEDARNKANLWYSSTRAQGLAGDAQDYNNSKADAIASAQQSLNQITQQLSSAKRQSQGSVQSAEAEAYQRYLNAIMTAPPSAIPPGASTSTPGTTVGTPVPAGPGSNTAGHGATYTDANSTGYGYAAPRPQKPQKPGQASRNSY